MKPQWQVEQIKQAYSCFFEQLHAERLEPFDISFDAVYADNISLSVELMWADEIGNIQLSFDSLGVPLQTWIVNFASGNTRREAQFEIELPDKVSSCSHTTDLIPWVITKIGEYQSVPQDLEIVFVINFHSNEEDYFERKLDALLQAGADTEGSLRWQVITTFMGLAEEAGYSPKIDLEEPDYVMVLQQYQDAGIDLSSEEQVFAFVLGLMQSAEVLWYKAQHDGSPIDEFVSTFAVFRGILAVLQQYLPDDFVPYLSR